MQFILGAAVDIGQLHGGHEARDPVIGS